MVLTDEKVGQADLLTQRPTELELLHQLSLSLLVISCDNTSPHQIYSTLFCPTLIYKIYCYLLLKLYNLTTLNSSMVGYVSLAVEQSVMSDLVNFIQDTFIILFYTYTVGECNTRTLVGIVFTSTF